MVPVSKEKKKWDGDEEDDEPLQTTLKVGKKKLKKITKDGPFGGRNR